MSKIYVVRSVEGHYLSKHNEWLSGKDSSAIYFAKHQDVALNQLIDITIKDINVRAKIVECELDDKQKPVVEIITETDLFTEVEETEASDNSETESTVEQTAVA